MVTDYSKPVICSLNSNVTTHGVCQQVLLINAVNFDKYRQVSYSIVGKHASISREVFRGRKLLPGVCEADVGVLSCENLAQLDRNFTGTYVT